MPVCHVTGLANGTLLTTPCIVHARYESMLHLNVIRTCPLSKFVRNSVVSTFLLAVLQRHFPCEDLDKQNRTVDRTAHSSKQLGLEDSFKQSNFSLHARLAGKFTWVVTA